MARVLDRLMAPRAPIDSVRKHGVEEFHGTSLEESDKAKFLLKKLQRALDEINVHLNKWPNVRSHYCKVQLMIGGS